jgi:hypothetical protein
MNVWGIRVDPAHGGCPSTPGMRLELQRADAPTRGSRTTTASDYSVCTSVPPSLRLTSPREQFLLAHTVGALDTIDSVPHECFAGCLTPTVGVAVSLETGLFALRGA